MSLYGFQEASGNGCREEHSILTFCFDLLPAGNKHPVADKRQYQDCKGDQ